MVEINEYGEMLEENTPWYDAAYSHIMDAKENVESLPDPYIDERLIQPLSTVSEFYNEAIDEENLIGDEFIEDRSLEQAFIESSQVILDSIYGNGPDEYDILKSGREIDKHGHKLQEFNENLRSAYARTVEGLGQEKGKKWTEKAQDHGNIGMAYVELWELRTEFTDEMVLQT